MLKSKLTFRS